MSHPRTTDRSADQAAGSVQRPAAVRFDGVTKTYGNGFQALAPVDLSVEAGRIVSIVGPSGCGKTTVLRMAAGLSAPTTGELHLHSERKAYVFQDPTLMAWRSVLANIETIARIRKVPRARRRAEALAALELVGLTEHRRSLPRELSGGMRMRVSLARALASDPDLMLMDEPFAALDEFTRDRMADELIRLWREKQFAVVFITHSIREAVHIAHEVVVMASGPGRVLEVVASPSPPSVDPDAPRDLAALDDVARRIAGQLVVA